MKKYDAADLLEIFLQHPAVCTDTRNIKPGDLFFALKGANFDGNRFAEKALQAGAAYAVIDDPAFASAENPALLLVDDVLSSLQQLAHLYRRRLGATILGLTGSNGKTTTKELIAAVLSTEKRIFATAGNYNNHIGVPLTLLAIPPETEIAIIEMGTNQPGDIAELVQIAEPDYGLITNIGKAHLERLGSVEGIQHEKGALFRFVKARGKGIFVNEADPRVVQLAQGASHVMGYGQPGAACKGKILEMDMGGMKMEISHQAWPEPVIFESQLSGAYNFINMLAAVSVGVFFGISRAAIQKGIFSYSSGNNRSQLVKRGSFQLWLDAYNANPSSMKAAINYILLEKPEDVAVILGDMFELGDHSEAEHRGLGLLLNENPPGLFIGIGKEMQAAVAVYQGEKHAFPDVAAAQAPLAKLIEGKKRILIKGSRGMALERLLDFMESD